MSKKERCPSVSVSTIIMRGQKYSRSFERLGKLSYLFPLFRNSHAAGKLLRKYIFERSTYMLSLSVARKGRDFNAFHGSEDGYSDMTCMSQVRMVTAI